ncbi:ABC transporter substrate-binding protein [Halospeciosus flavus]|uniref:ABC transporter substrate-binding protein n=1 Tax=Halospeciosus flavus TaxID=3032283 RepID=A0ABD5Z5N0_9EURY|nr:ABC transporter substrate-binding protein [Halospeciosus flavus]
MDDTSDHWTPTRRDYLRGSAMLVGGGLLAGCTGGSSGENAMADDGTTASTTTTADSSYTVSMAPVGEVSFDRVPESVFTVFPQYADMAVALGHGDAVDTVYVPKMSGTTMNHYYHHLDGVSFDWEGLQDPLADGITREEVYELGSDVHFVDPAYVTTQDGWNRSDVEEVASTVGPWFGNFYSGTHATAPEAYRDDYQYYSLWELFGKVAQVFQETERYRQLEAVHADLLETIREGLPPAEERPTAVRVTMAPKRDVFYTYHLNEPGYWLADTRPLGATDAFAAKDWSNLWGTVDFETMLEADPDVILNLWGLTPYASTATTRERLQDHPVGSQLTAVQNDRVYPAGMRYQGPLMNLFQLEMGAKQLYPEQFGAWPGYTDGEPYPDIPTEEQLFDRQRVAAIVAGDR